MKDVLHYMISVLSYHNRKQTLPSHKPTNNVNGCCSRLPITLHGQLLSETHLYSTFTDRETFNEEVTTLSQLPPITEAINHSRHSLFGHVRHTDQAAPAHQVLHLSVTRRQGSDSLAPGQNNQAIHKNAVWSRSPRAQGSLLLTLGVL